MIRFVLSVAIVAMLAGCSSPDQPDDAPASAGLSAQETDAGAGASAGTGLGATKGTFEFEADGQVLLATPARCATGEVLTTLDESRIAWTLDIPAEAIGQARVNLTFEDPPAQDLNMYMLHEGRTVASSAAFNIQDGAHESLHAIGLGAGEYQFLIVGCIAAATNYVLTLEGTWAIPGK